MDKFNPLYYPGFKRGFFAFLIFIAIWLIFMFLPEGGVAKLIFMTAIAIVVIPLSVAVPVYVFLYPLIKYFSNEDTAQIISGTTFFILTAISLYSYFKEVF